MTQEKVELHFQPAGPLREFMEALMGCQFPFEFPVVKVAFDEGGASLTAITLMSDKVLGGLGVKAEEVVAMLNRATNFTWWYERDMALRRREFIGTLRFSREVEAG